MPSTAWTKPDTSTRPLAVVGAGLMGRRIAMMWISAGYTVILCEKTLDEDGAVDYITENKDKQAEKLGTKVAELKVTSSLQEACENAWMVIEAVPEKLELKIEVLAEIDAIAPPDCVITSNSSSLRTSQMIVKTKRNYRICNGHYYMPPEQTYYELMSCGETDPDIFPFLMEKAASAGFQPVHAKVESTGLVFNRIWASIKREVLLVLAEGVSDGHTIDEMFKGWFKAAKGPCQMMDTVGLDTVYNIEVVYTQQRDLDTTARDWLKETYVDKGNLGAKTGKGLLG
ncbi:Dehydrogenase multihelical [Penicillium brevicompactum]|uniref:Dehydrogenase multihelical n=1 Tax=Penicillium brevicompactum TaxID=5074 RepID=UPI00253FFC1A|nr:Dehydrogenase multihelical [Penicillium brevicompactum]KAJ5326646.1 Dehydrogenase multihelical [Penicillium brevicompactum]